MRPNLTLYNSPFATLLLFFRIILTATYRETVNMVLNYKLRIFLASILCVFALQNDMIYNNVIHILWWFGLGVVSSIGLGSGLHTFVLFTGPYVSKTSLEYITHSFYDILWRVFPVCFIWGAGSAVGELPPYFLSKAASEKEEKEKEMSKIEKILLIFLKKYAFITVLLFASVPNPLFDIAGVLCGRYHIGLMTFFSATFIGKAIVKPMLQASVIIYTLTSDISMFDNYPMIQSALMSVKNQYGVNSGEEVSTVMGLVNRVWEYFIVLMVVYFIVSIINGTVKEHLEKEDEKNEKEYKLI